MATERGDKSRREEFRQVARLPVDGIRSDARGEVNNHVELETRCLQLYTGNLQVTFLAPPLPSYVFGASPAKLRFENL